MKCYQPERCSQFSIAVMIAMIAALSPLLAQATCNAEEVGYVATFEVKPGSEEVFEAAINKLSATVMRVESGVILYAPYKGAGNTYYMLERYQDEATRQSHATSEEVRALFVPLMATLVGQADIQPISAVCP